MSVRAFDWATAQDMWSPESKVLLAALGALADDTHSCKPALEDLADATELEIGELRELLDECEDAGLIHVHPSPNSRKKRYQLRCEEGAVS